MFRFLYKKKSHIQLRHLDSRIWHSKCYHRHRVHPWYLKKINYWAIKNNFKSYYYVYTCVCFRRWLLYNQLPFLCFSWVWFCLLLFLLLLHSDNINRDGWWKWSVYDRIRNAVHQWDFQLFVRIVRLCRRQWCVGYFDDALWCSIQRIRQDCRWKWQRSVVLVDRHWRLSISCHCFSSAAVAVAVICDIIHYSKSILIK